MSIENTGCKEQRKIGRSELIKTLEEENERLRAALEFYADGNNWSDRRTLREFRREPEKRAQLHYFTSQLGAYEAFGGVVAREALRNTNPGLWRVHGNKILEDTWNELAKKYHEITKENDRLRRFLSLRPRG